MTIQDIKGKIKEKLLERKERFGPSFLQQGQGPFLARNFSDIPTELFSLITKDMVEKGELLDKSIDFEFILDLP